MIKRSKRSQERFSEFVSIISCRFVCEHNVQHYSVLLKGPDFYNFSSIMAFLKVQFCNKISKAFYSQSSDKVAKFRWPNQCLLCLLDFCCLRNGPSSVSFSFIFGILKLTIQILQQINVKMSLQYPPPGFELTTFRLYESPPLTTSFSCFFLFLAQLFCSVRSLSLRRWDLNSEKIGLRCL